MRGNINKLWFSRLSVGQQSKTKAKLSVPKLKVWSTFSKVVGNAYKTLCYRKFY